MIVVNYNVLIIVQEMVFVILKLDLVNVMQITHPQIVLN